MKILLANKFYYRRGGAEVSVINLENLLRKHGHEVAVFAMQHPENLPSAYEKYFPKEVDFTRVKFRNFFTYISRPLASKEVKDKFSRLLEKFCPDVVHLNNIHSQLSPVIAKIAHERGIKVVWTLHDYKMLCPRYDCMRNNKPCSLCYTGKRAAVRYSCLKNSRLASILASWEAEMWNREKLEKYTTTFICPSDFLRNEMIRGGFNSQKLIKLNNFIDTAKITQPVCLNKENYYCYVGRLSPEKGVETLLKAAAELPYTLRVIGSGILEQELKQKYQVENIIFAGYKSWSEIEAIAGKAMFLVMPSECLENNPIATLESLALGTPVLGARIGGIPELIEEGANGMLFESRNIEDMKNKIQKMFTANFDYRAIAEKSRICYSEENHYNELMKIYNQE
ncbi:MAG: glycosyltransferase [Dysgonamonadaceae bacterium]|jgi:glycosyltransferase involved in cell wall biosynthesis|nr:glycosyltransferase [Dysgonamonadaceae bacterium]